MVSICLMGADKRTASNNEQPAEIITAKLTAITNSTIILTSLKILNYDSEFSDIIIFSTSWLSTIPAGHLY
jgi:hypothetical protein